MSTPTPSSPSLPLPDKLYFKIGEVSALAGVPAHVLRFWESEFPRLKPRRTDSGQRLYTRRDVELILEVKRLLYGRKFTIEGARRHLRSTEERLEKDPRQLLAELRAELTALRDLLG
jgi:DNA-binding transcriptional MerR regulator